jgi:hypothetical protein
MCFLGITRFWEYNKESSTLRVKKVLKVIDGLVSENHEYVLSMVM